MKKLPDIKSGKYLHTKSGRYYELIGVALHTETEEPTMVYKPLYPSDYELFVRPHEIFVEQVELNGQEQPRFKWVDPV